MSYMSSQVGKGDKIYHPENVNKYIGKPPYCVCRSSWELIFCRWADNNPSIIEWVSEPMAIPYIDRTSKDSRGLPKRRRYFPDFLVKVLNKQGDIDVWLVEVKPYKETQPPKRTKRKSQKTLMYEDKTWAVNTAKWKSAEAYCKKRGWYFKILTEKQLIK